MIVIVTGGRDYRDRESVTRVLEQLRPLIVVAGDATGADTLALNWARNNGIKSHCFKAAWALHGRSAGPRRNLEMLQAFPTGLVVAFPGGKGTLNCVGQARRLGHSVIEVTQLASGDASHTHGGVGSGTSKH